MIDRLGNTFDIGDTVKVIWGGADYNGRQGTVIKMVDNKTRVDFIVHLENDPENDFIFSPNEVDKV